MASVLNILAIVILGRMPRVKTFWIVVTTAHRLLGFVPAVVALAVLRGGDRIGGAQAVLIALAASHLFANLPPWPVRCSNAGMGDAPRTVVESFAGMKSGDVTLRTGGRHADPSDASRYVASPNRRRTSPCCFVVSG